MATGLPLPTSSGGRRPTSTFTNGQLRPYVTAGPGLYIQHLEGHRTNLCTTRTRPRHDLSVTWPSQGTFPRSHPSARGPALTTFWPSHRVDRLGSLVVDGELDEIVVGIAEVRAGRHAARARSGPSLWCHAVRVV